jgi:hypothetical protein
MLGEDTESAYPYLENPANPTDVLRKAGRQLTLVALMPSATRVRGGRMKELLCYVESQPIDPIDGKLGLTLRVLN